MCCIDWNAVTAIGTIVASIGTVAATIVALAQSVKANSRKIKMIVSETSEHIDNCCEGRKLRIEIANIGGQVVFIKDLVVKNKHKPIHNIRDRFEENPETANKMLIYPGLSIDWIYSWKDIENAINGLDKDAPLFFGAINSFGDITFVKTSYKAKDFMQGD